MATLGIILLCILCLCLLFVFPAIVILWIAAFVTVPLWLIITSLVIITLCFVSAFIFAKSKKLMKGVLDFYEKLGK